jgi:CubicO group peptidase (beta-lactamase class C family)
MNQANSEASFKRIRRSVSRIRRQPALQSDAWPGVDLETYMAAECIPGASWALIDGGELVWAQGYGVLEAGSPAPVTTDTRFQAASISKPVAALTALSLVGQGKLALDEDIRRHQTTWSLPDNASWQPRVSLRQLLSHSAGVNVEDFPGYPTRDPVPSLLQILTGEKPANTPALMVDTLPGLQYRYSGGGYTILQQLIEDITGQPFWQAAKERVLDPVGMVHSTFLCPLPVEWQPLAAAGHRADGEPIQGRWHLHPESAAAGLWTTPTDLALFIIHIEQALRGLAEPVISKALLAEMLTPQVRIPETSTGWMGLGLRLSGEKDDTYFGHGGSNEGYRCQMIARRGKGQAAVIMTNANNGWILKEEWMNTIALEYGWSGYAYYPPAEISLAPEILARYAGRYRKKDGSTLVVSAASTGLVLEIEGQPPMAMHPQSPDSFFLRPINATIRFRWDEARRCHGLVFRQNGEDFTFYNTQ